MHDAVGAVSIARCAELLTLADDKIDRSALSRYCDTHGLKLGSRGRAVLVDFETVRDHRRSNYTREVMSGQASSAAPAQVQPAPAPAPTNVTPLPARDDPQRELKQVQLRDALRKEAADEGLTTPTAEVDAGAADAIAALRAAFAQAATEQADLVAAELHLPSEQVRPLRAALKRFARLGQERFAQVIARTIADANEPETEAYRRLTVLTAHAIRLRADRKGASDRARA